MFRCNSIVLLVSRFDEFIANILRIYFKAFPNQLKNPDKTITYDEIVELNSVDQILDTFMEKGSDLLLTHLKNIIEKKTRVKPQILSR